MKTLKVSSSNNSAVLQAVDLFIEIIERAKERKSVLNAVFSDVNDELSSKIIEILQKEARNVATVVMLKQNIKLNIAAQVLYCNAIESQLPFKVLVVSGEESYLLAKSNEISGAIDCKVAATEAKAVLSNIMAVYI